MQSLKIPNFDAPNIQEIARLDADLAVGNTTINLHTAQNFDADDYFVIGLKASEGSELMQVDSMTTAVIVVSKAPAQLPHNRFDDVTLLFGNKIKMYRASNVNGLQPADSAFAALGSPIDIDVDQIDTGFTDPDGSNDYWYAFTYYNSTTTEETDIASSRKVRGGGIGNYCSIQSIKQEAGLASNRNISDSLYDEKRRAAQQMINSKLSGIYTIPFTAPVNPGIEDLARRISAALVMMSSIGGQYTRLYDEGKDKLTDALSELDKLRSREDTLVDENGDSIALPVSQTGSGFSMYPDASTANPDGSTGGFFHVADVQGYESRVY